MSIEIPPGARWWRDSKCSSGIIDSRIPFYNLMLAVLPKDKTVIDIGASGGYYVKALIADGYDAIGIDGTPGVHEKTNGLIKWVNLVGDCSEFYNAADWGLFIEVGEHVPLEYEDILIDNITRIVKEGLLVTWSTNLYVRTHVNCQSPRNVSKKFVRRGWFLDKEKTKIGSNIIFDSKHKWHRDRSIHRNVLVFRKR